MIEVIKSDGSREAFSEEKLRRSIQAAAEEAEIPARRVKQVVSDAAREPIALAKGPAPVETMVLREKILARLDAIEPAVSEAWRGFDEKRK
jgi:transcriptional regulator NrdR family protein